MVGLAHLSLPLSQNGFRGGSSLDLRRHVFGSLFMATGMENSLSNPFCVHPNKLLQLVQPLHLEFLLADRAAAGGESWIIWNRNVRKFGDRGSCGIVGPERGLRRNDTSFALDFTGFDPVLGLVKERPVVKTGILTSSSTYQLLCWPRDSASSMRCLT